MQSDSKPNNPAMFPRTTVESISLPRLIIGTNWFLGYSHTSLAKDKFIKEFQTRERIVSILKVFLEYNIDAVMGPLSQYLEDSICQAEQDTGRRIIRIYTPSFELTPGTVSGPNPGMTAGQVFDECRSFGTDFCLLHQAVTDTLVDRMTQTIRGLDGYTKMIRERGMIPGLSTHMPETIVYADKMNADVATYIQLYNAAGFLMQVEADWVMRVIRDARHPVMTIKPLAAGKLLPVVGLSFVFSTIRDTDMTVIGTTTPDEAREVIEISLDLLSDRIPGNLLQKTRSKKSLE
jgi:hypothetical protein